MICDGCNQEREGIGFHSMFGHIMRYCAECGDIWIEFKQACEAEGARVQALLDIWELDMRKKIPLKLTPLDMPRLVVNKDGKNIVLG